MTHQLFIKQLIKLEALFLVKMKNVLRVLKNDLKNIIKNKQALVIVIGLIVLPSLYAWFNIAALVDPYGNASNLPIAVYSNDTGTTVSGEELNVGSSLLANLQTNDELAWQFPENQAELEDRVNTGEYYAAIIIPENFSQDLVAAVDSYESPSINYVVNEKVNAIAPKMTEAGAEGITAEINSQINGIVTKYLVDYSNQLNDKVLSSEEDYDAAINNLNQLINQFETIDSAFASYDQITNQVDYGIEEIDQFNRQVTTDINSIDYSSIYSSLDQLAAIPETDRAVIENIRSQIEGLEAKTSEFQIDVDTSQYSSVDSTISNFIYNQWPTYKTQIVAGRDKLSEVGNDYQSIANYLNKDGSRASDFMANPVSLDTETLYPVTNYGSASMPFYTTLCLWVGSLLMASLLAFDSNLKVSKLEQYFGKLLLFISIGILQAIIVTTGDVYILDITVARPLYLLAFDVFIIVVFSTIVYSLVYVFGNIGKALAIVLLVLSISGGGGNFPIEVSGPFFNTIYPYLPFTYGVKMLREAAAGIYWPTVVECVKIMSIMFGLAIGFGVLGTKYLKPLFDRFDQKSRESHIIH